MTDDPLASLSFEDALKRLETIVQNLEGGSASLEEADDHFERQWARLPARLRHLTDPDAHPVQVSERMRRPAEAIDARNEEL